MAQKAAVEEAGVEYLENRAHKSQRVPTRLTHNQWVLQVDDYDD